MMNAGDRHAGLIGWFCHDFIFVIVKKKIKWPGTERLASIIAVLASGSMKKFTYNIRVELNKTYAVEFFILVLPKKVWNGYMWHDLGAHETIEPWLPERCNAVDKREAKIATKLPPTPLTTGWRTAMSLK
jgi:hypothetical protein